MARSKQPKSEGTDPAKDADEIFDAQEADPTAPDSVDAAKPEESDDAAQAPVDEPVDEPAELETEEVETSSHERDTDDTVGDDTSRPLPPAAIVPPPPPKRGGFGALVLGGVVAAAIGAAAALFLLPEGWRVADAGPDPAITQAMEAQADRIAGLEDSLNAAVARLDDLAARPDETEQIETLRQELRANSVSAESDAVAALENRLADLSARVEELAARPASQDADLPTDQLEAMKAEIDRAVADARAEIETARSQAAQIEADAQAAADFAAAEAALAQVAASLDSGAAFSAPLDAVRETGAAIPGPLAEAAATGVPTLSALQAGYPEAARSALAASTSVGAEGSTIDRVTSFLRTQTGARSLTPRDGDDPDAVLSRAEAALRDGDLATTLAELDALPPDGRDAMSGWIADASARQAALTALGDLRATIETN